jgi:hypothetical protein
MSDPHPDERPVKKPVGASSVEHYFRNIIVLNHSLSEEGEAFRDSYVPTVGAERAKNHAILWVGCKMLRSPSLLQASCGL